MAILELLVIRDSASNSFSAPLAFVAVGQGVRWFTDMVNNPDKDSQYYMHPDDFELFHMGEFDSDDAGTKLHPPISVCRAKDVAIRDSVIN